MTSALTPLLRQALTYIDAERREQCSQIAVYFQVGYGTIEIASEMGLSWKQVADLRGEVQRGVVRALESDGYAPGEVVRYLGVPTAVVQAARAA